MFRLGTVAARCGGANRFPGAISVDICRWCGGRRGASMSSSEGAGKPVPDGKARPEPEASATTPETTRSGVASPNALPLPLR
ncbi:MAG: hypothetical protein SPK06_07660 [Kiritimatiellia bacterium]|nr:hypothetical protein [Kiritimatiellia bacterium]